MQSGRDSLVGESIHSDEGLTLETSVVESFTVANYRLTHSASELSGYTCTSSLTMNKKFQYRGFAECGIENFEFIVSERVQVNPDH